MLTASAVTRPMPREVPQNQMIIGYVLLAVSFLCPLSIALLPFTSLGTGAATVVAGILVMVGEGAFVASAALVGPQVWQAVKSVWQNLTRR